MEFYRTSRRIQQPRNTILSMLVQTSDRVWISSAFLGSEQKQPGGENKRCHTTPAGSERGYVLVSPHENNIKQGGGRGGLRGDAQVHLHKWLGATQVYTAAL